MINGQLHLDSVRLRDFLTVKRGEFTLRVKTNRDYWWYMLWASHLNGRKWLGQARQLDPEDGQPETWAALLVDVETGVGTSLTAQRPLLDLLGELAQVLDDLCCGRGLVV